MQGRALDGLKALRKQPVNTKLLSETQVKRLDAHLVLQCNSFAVQLHQVLAGQMC